MGQRGRKTEREKEKEREEGERESNTGGKSVCLAIIRFCSRSLVSFLDNYLEYQHGVGTRTPYKTYVHKDYGSI